MMKRLMRATTFALVAVLATVSCGDDENSDGIDSSNTLPAHLVPTFASLAPQFGTFAVHGFSFAGTNVSFAPGAPGAASPMERHVADLLARTLPAGSAPFLVHSPTCEPDVVGEGDDADGDGVPDDMTITYTAENCTVTDAAAGVIRVQRGSIRYRDISNDLYGFELVVTDLRGDTYDSTTKGWTHQIISVREQSKMHADRGDWSISIDGDLQAGTADTVSLAQVVKYSVQASLDPSGTLDESDPLPDGEITLSGSVDVTLKFGRFKFTLFAPGPLHYESTSCSDIDDGIVDLRLNGSTTEGVRTQWTDCGVTAYEFFGSDVL